MANAPRGIDCRTAVKQLWDYLDQELTEDRMMQVRAHLESCEECLPHHDFGRRFLDALQSTRATAAMPADAKRKVMAMLREAGYEGE